MQILIKNAPAFLVMAKTLKETTSLGKMVIFDSNGNYSILANRTIIRYCSQCGGECNPQGRVVMDLPTGYLSEYRDSTIKNLSANPDKVFEAIGELVLNKKTVRTESKNNRIINLKFIITRDEGKPHVNISWIDKHVRGMTYMLEAAGLKVIEGDINER